MATEITIKLNSRGLRAVLRGREVQRELARRSEAIRRATGRPADFEVRTGQGPNRARASVGSITYDGMLAEAKQRALTRAIDAGR